MRQQLLSIHIKNNDPYLNRRARSFAIFVLILLGCSLASLGIDLATHWGALSNISSIVVVALTILIYFINRSGRLVLAANSAAAIIILIALITVLIQQSPIPSVFYPLLALVIATAFGRPRDVLIWAGVSTLLPFVVNLLLYRSLLPVDGPLTLPDGRSAAPLIMFELTALLLYWIVASICALSAYQNEVTLGESRDVAESAMLAQLEVSAQRTSLEARNIELIEVRQQLEDLVAELTVPIVPLMYGVALLPMVGSFDAKRTEKVEQETLAFVAARRLHALVIDLSGIGTLRDGNFDGLQRLCAALRLLGVHPVLAGLGPQLALQLSSSQIALPQTVATVQDALEVLREQYQHQHDGAQPWQQLRA